MFDTLIAEIVARKETGYTPTATMVVNLFIERLCGDRLDDALFSTSMNKRLLIDGPIEPPTEHGVDRRMMFTLFDEIVELRFLRLFPKCLSQAHIGYNYAYFSEVYAQALQVFEDTRAIPIDQQTMFDQNKMAILHQFLIGAYEGVNQESCLLRADPISVHHAVQHGLTITETVYQAGGFAWCKDRVYGLAHNGTTLRRTAKASGMRYRVHTHKNAIFFDHKRIVLDIGEARHIKPGMSLLPDISVSAKTVEPVL